MGAKEFYILPGGYLTLDRSIFVTGVGMGEKIKAPVYSVLVIHDQGPLLLDVGLNPDGLTSPEKAWGPRAKIIQPEFTEEDDIRNRLKALNLKVSDIRAVLITHLHWDHTGGLRFFKHCPIIVQKSELRFALYPDAHVAGQYMRNHFDHHLDFETVEGDRVLMSGVSLVKTPGHTPGHQSVVLTLDSGKVFLFPGDAVPLQENAAQGVAAGNNWNAELSMDSLFRLTHLTDLLGGKLLPSHDISFWETMTKSPHPYR